MQSEPRDSFISKISVYLLSHFSTLNTNLPTRSLHHILIHCDMWISPAISTSQKMTITQIWKKYASVYIKMEAPNGLILIGNVFLFKNMFIQNTSDDVYICHQQAKG